MNRVSEGIINGYKVLAALKLAKKFNPDTCICVDCRIARSAGATVTHTQAINGVNRLLNELQGEN